jgi:hypothetical protein
VTQLASQYAQRAQRATASQLAATEAELDQVRGLLADAVSRLVRSFSEIAAQTASQRKLAQEISTARG